MAATLSSFIPPIFRTNHQQSERYDADFSYSYSELPVFRSKFENVKDGGDQRPKSTCGVVSGNLISPKRSVVGDADILYTKQYEERKAISLPYQHIDQHVSLPRAKYGGRTNLPPTLNNEYKANEATNKLPLKFKIIPDKGKQYFGDYKSGNANKCEDGGRKRFELQTTCTNLPQKKIVDKEKAEAQNVNAAKLKKFEETKKAIELQSSTCVNSNNASGNFPQKSLTKGNSWESYSTYEGVATKRSSTLGKERELFARDARDSDKRNFPPKSDSFDRKLDNKLKGNVSPKSLDFINDIGEYLNRSDYGSCDSSAGFSFSPSKSLDSGDNYVQGSSDIKDSSTVASSVRRLRNSIFSSLKLPRKIGSKISSQAPMMGTLGRDSRSAAAAAAGKRKSAVELLAESKAFYVKSETVLDRKQELPLRVCCPVSSTSGAHYATLSGRHRRGGGEPLQNQLRKLLGSTSMSPNDAMHDPRVHPSYYPEKRRTSRDCCDWEVPSHPSSAARSHYNSGTFSANSSSGTSGSKGQVKSDPEHSRISNSVPYSTKSLNRPSSSGDNRIFFPDSFVVPKPSRSDPANVFSKNYSISSAYSSPEKIDARKILSMVDAYDDPDMKMWSYDASELLEDFSTISPPAEYAITERSNYRYVRSNSHSQTMKAAVQDNYTVNINSHKSLPDLHKQAEHYVEDGSRLSGASGSIGGTNYLGVSCETAATVRSSEALSSYSKATSGRSNRSSVFSSKTSDGHSRRSLSCHNSDPSRGSAEDPYYYNRSGSSYARDSGGSSGHCSAGLGMVAPPPPTSSTQRRDSGSSTQHSSARSHHRYSSYYESYSPHQLEAPPQFQDGAPSPPRASPSPPRPHHLHHVAPLHPPEPPLALNATLQICANFGSRSMHGATVTRVATGVEESGGQTLVGIHFQASIPPLQFQDSQPHGYASYGSLTSYGRRDSGSRESRHSPHRPSSYGPPQPIHAAPQPLPRHTVAREEPPVEDNTHSPPGVLGNFRRQRCLRYKQRRPVLRSKSDISDRYWRPEPKGPVAGEKPPTTPPSSTDNESPDRLTRSQLDKFFNQLGMSDETYEEVILSSLKKPRSKTEHQKNQVLVHSKKSSPNLDLTTLNTSPKAFITPEDDTGVSSESPVFSDISIADSNHITNNGDYTVQGMGGKDPKPYRSCEPPSIVERNARIIKWLCNCRKLQTITLP